MREAPDQEFLALQEALAGRYSLERELGRGGMGIVYLAREVRLDRPVALKLLPPQYAAQSAQRERFLREARTAARLSHPHIVPIHAVDEVGAFVFIVMAYVEGETLEQRIRARGPLPATEAARILRELAWALAYAHAQGVVHRDIKPGNILLEAGSGRALVSDFGIAYVSDTRSLADTAEVIGTAEYMSPEQAAGKAVDGRSDLYALGAVGYYMLSGRVPFEGATIAATLAKQITQAAAPLSSVAPEVPAPLALPGQGAKRALRRRRAAGRGDRPGTRAARDPTRAAQVHGASPGSISVDGRARGRGCVVSGDCPHVYPWRPGRRDTGSGRGRHHCNHRIAFRIHAGRDGPAYGPAAAALGPQPR
jgi:serine/threonine-protein kinase